MANSYFQFKQFTVQQGRSAMKVTTDGCLFGAWVAQRVVSSETGVGSVLDIGTGTGLLSLMLAQKDPTTQLDAIEIDNEAYEQALQNVKDSPWSSSIRIIQGDAKEFEFTQQYDIIISNPPFYEKELKGNDTRKNIAHHNEGLLLPELFDIIKKILHPSGRFYLLQPYKRKEEIKGMLLKKGMSAQQLVFVRQSVEHDYFRIIIEGKLTTDETVETSITEIAIKNKEGQYTEQFVNLLKNYYLHL